MSKNIWTNIVVYLLLLETVLGREIWRGCEEGEEDETKAVGDVNKITTTITLIHVNDIHSHFEQVNVNTGRCRPEMASAGDCYGGVARMAAKIQEVRKRDPEALLLNAGDYYQGTIWYSLFKYRPVVEFSNLLNYSAVALGNHDFDDSISGLQPYLDTVNFPVVAANVDSEDIQGLKSSVVLMVAGAKVGVIGYVTTNTPVISQPDNRTHFRDEIEAVRSEAKKLKKAGVDIIIATGHSGYDLDMEMAESIEELDLVVGGHSHTFLYTGSQPSTEKPEGPYPTYMEQGNGRVVPVVQAYCYSKYMGVLTLQFDGDGELVQPVAGAGVLHALPVLLDQSVEKLTWVEDLLKPWQLLLEPYKVTVGHSAVKLDLPGTREGSLGNVVADSMAAAWPDTSIAFINEGGIRADLEAGDLTGEDIYNVLPFNNTVDRVVLRGRDIRNVLEDLIADLCSDGTCRPREFVQVAGLRVVYDIRTANQGRRVSLLQWKDKAGRLRDIKDRILYPVALTSFLTLAGKSGFADTMVDRKVGPTDYQAFYNYVQANSPINQSTEGRITINYLRKKRTT